MTKIIAFVCFVIMLDARCLAGTDTLTTAQMGSTMASIEQLLGVPAVYMVANCRILATHARYGVVLHYYCRDSDGGCATIGAAGFSTFWQRQLDELLRQHYKIILTDIEMQKGNKTMHWQQKTFAAPR